MKILVADDHALIRDALRHLVAQLDPTAIVQESPDCDGARDCARDNPDLDLVLLDITLPGGGGLALLSELHGNYPMLPIVMLSAIEDAATMRDALARGAMGYITKSSSNEVMLGALRLVLSGGHYVPLEALGNGSVATDAPPASANELKITDRQRQVLALMAKGNSNKLICRELGMAEATVKFHVTAILRALKVTTRAQAIVAVNRLGLDLDALRGAGETAE